MSEKLQKVLARVGLGSRREIEGWIQAGRVTVDGKVAELGCRVTPAVKIRVDNKPIKVIKTQRLKTRVLLYHKPLGEICTRSDPEGRPTVFDTLPELLVGRWISVGRLDINSSGLLILTNDGELVNNLTHPSSGHEREYAVRVFGEVTNEMMTCLKKGVELEDGLAKFSSIRRGRGQSTNCWYRVTVDQGRNRLVRRLWESQGVKVSRLIRTRFGKYSLPRSLPPAEWIELHEK